MSDMVERMPMTGMVETIAGAIAQTLVGSGLDGLPNTVEGYRGAARAVLEELRAHEVIMRDPRDGGMIHEVRGAPNDIWQALLAAALSPQV